MRTNYQPLLLTALLCFLTSHVFADDTSIESKSDTTVSMSTGFDTTVGSYGMNRNSISMSIPVSISYDTENYSFSLMIPYISQVGPEGSILGSRTRLFKGANKLVVEKGLGDIIGSITRDIYDDDESISLDIKGIIKFATADVNKGLGTGVNDYSAQLDAYKEFDTSILTGSVGYTVLGSPGVIDITGIQQDIEFNNVFYTLADFTYELSDQSKIGLTFHTEQASQIDGVPQKDLTANFSFKTSNVTTFRCYMLKGYSEASPDWGTGASISGIF
jgi:hypothetical protein